MTLNIQRLETYLAVTELGNIQDAADRIGRSPSAVSMALKALEEEVGGALFVADRKDSLTELGRYLQGMASGLIANHHRTEASVKAFARGELGKVDIACVPSIAGQVLPHIISKFHQSWPHVRLDIRDTDTDAVTRLVENGVAELGIAGQPAFGQTSFQRLFYDRLMLVLPASWSLKMMPEPTIDASSPFDQFEDKPFITHGLAASSSTPAILALHARATMVIHNTTSIIAMVREGVGFSVLPFLSLLPAPQGVTIMPLDHHFFSRPVGLIRRLHAPLSPAADLFLALLRDHIHDHISADGHWQYSAQ